MPTWSDLTTELNAQPERDRGQWLSARQFTALSELAVKRGHHVVLYASAFLQKPQLPPLNVSITHEDLNGLMSVIHGMDWSKGLTLILHTPGGVTNAAESIVAYLRSKFEYLEVIVPTFAMSAGTMISLAADKVLMGRQSQLGPIDPQMQLNGKSVSARAVVEQFDRAKDEIMQGKSSPQVWAPALQTLGPAILQEAQNALDYSEQIVAEWLTKYMLKAKGDAASLGPAIAHHFNDASTHKSHGRRIGRDEARSKGVAVEDLEDDQALQEIVLTSYHLTTISFENGPAVKLMQSDTGQTWLKNFLTPEEREALMKQQATMQPVRAAGGFSKPAPGAKPSRR